MKQVFQRDICTPVSIAAPFAIAKIWKQLNCLPVGNVVYIHNGISFSLKKVNPAICDNMDKFGGCSN